MNASEDLLTLVAFDQSVREMRRVARDASRLEQLPALVIEVIRDGRWKRRMVDGQIVEFSTFEAFCNADPTPGLGITWNTLQNLCRDDVESRNAIAREVQREPGRPTVGDAPMTSTERKQRFKQRALGDVIPSTVERNETVDNIHGFVPAEAPQVQVERPTGTSVERALLRLGEQRPDLHAQVLAGAKSAHAACVEAGFRRRTITVPVDVERAVATLRRHFSADEIAQMVRLLGDVP